MVAPIRKRGNLLLCTLLIGNTISNCALALEPILGPALSSAGVRVVSALCMLCRVLVLTGLACACYGGFTLAPCSFLSPDGVTCAQHSCPFCCPT